jgi:hypothetical protein
MSTSYEWIGQGDGSGNWMDSSGVYVGQPSSPAPFPPTPGGSVPPLFGGGGYYFYGLTWLKNVVLLTRDYWDESLTNPASGQLFPVPNSGGTQTGQIYPY